MEDEVRNSIVRIRFDIGGHNMVTCGIIILINEGSCEIITESNLLRRCTGEIFRVSFPINGGRYGDELAIQKSSVIIGIDISKFVVSMNEVAYNTEDIKQVQFETSPVKTSDNVHTFVFPRETYPTPSGCWPGTIVDASQWNIFFLDCSFRAYAHFGSPVFNTKGHLVGICFASQNCTHTWTVRYLKKIFDKIFGEEKKKDFLC